MRQGSGVVFFVSGTGTDVGKTVATGLMARWLLAMGRDVITVKLVQTGNVGMSEDIEAHRRLMGGVRFPEDDAGLTAPQIFEFPSSPLLAARLEGKSVDVAKIADSVEACAAAHEVVLVEGAGGLAVPLTETQLTVDFASERGWPLVLVTCGSLGAINHALLSLEAAKSRGMSVAGVVHNSCFSADERLDGDAVAAISRHLVRLGYESRIVRIPRVDLSNPPEIDFGDIFQGACR